MLVSLLVSQILVAAVPGTDVAHDTLSSYSTIVPVQINVVAESAGFRYAKVSGRVLDSNRSPVPNALLSIDMIAGGRVNSAWVTTDAAGRFVRDSLLPGMRYVIEARCSGYKKAVSSPIVASADTARIIQLVLEAQTPQLAIEHKRARSPED